MTLKLIIGQDEGIINSTFASVNVNSNYIIGATLFDQCLLTESKQDNFK